jgi:hypothetical protein
MQIDYQLAESTVTVAGTREIGVDADGTEEVAVDATVTLGVRGERTWSRRLALGEGGADQDFAATLTPDGRLTSISYKSTGIGARVVDATLTLATVLAGLVTRAGTATRSLPPPEGWAAAHPDLAALRGRYRALVARAADELLAAREAAVGEPHRSFDIRRLARLLDDSRAELARLDALRDAWNAGRHVTRTERHTVELPLAVLPEQDGTRPPDPAALDERCRTVWTTLGVIVSVDPARGRPRHIPPEDGDELDLVRWRIPRPTRVWTWHPDPDGAPTLHSCTPVQVVDEHCDTAGVQLDTRFFGEVGVQLEFGDLGAPSRIAHGDTSTAGSVAGVVTAAPDRLDTGLAAGERLRAGLVRRLDAARAELERAGIAATDAQHAEVQRLAGLVLG